MGFTYRAGGEPCVAPEDDASCAQGGTLANGGDEIHLCGKGPVTRGSETTGKEDRQGGQDPACSDLVITPWSSPLSQSQEEAPFHFVLSV